ncbi:MAG: Lrp/AsnC family transcriptional regulator [Oscillospiraceae bacterium]|jgi:Lrp/AsnC family leucine-responsive transcriptional regulator|nr:Lrp/AsnC family transcriptional regulator [Oscillospiraceae bacterium]
MDAIDVKILQSLSKNARQKASAISQEVNLSVSAVIERIHKLEDGGVITGYTVLLDQRRLGNDISAWVEVCLEHPKYYDAFVARVQELDPIMTCYYLTGDFDFMLHVVAESSDALEAIHRKIKSLDGVSATKTHFVLKSVKENAWPLPDLS